MKLPDQINHELEFRFSDDKKALYTEMRFMPSGSNFIMNCNNCLYMEPSTYKMLINMDIANNNYPTVTDNYEAELRLFNDRGEVRNIKKIFFFNKYEDSIVEYFSKVLTLPIRLIGFWNNKKVELVFIEDYDNYYDPIDKIELLISKSLNIRKAEFVISPKIGLIRKLVSYSKYLVIPTAFCFLIFSQGVILLFLLYFCKKENYNLSTMG